MPKIFLISGLGADERLFKNLDLTGYDVVPVDWITPGKHDTLASYAIRLIKQFGIVAGSNVMGVSLGGMVTVEIAKQVQLKQAIIISSIKSKTEAPWYFNFFRAVPVYRLVPGNVLQKLGPLIRPLFGNFGGSKGVQLFYTMLKNSEPQFLTWAMRAVLGWNGQPAPYKINHLIGDADQIIHHSRVKDAVVIPKGDHMMVLSRGKELSPIIRNILNQ